MRDAAQRARSALPVGIAILVQYAATMVHHVYGGLHYGTPERLIIAAIFTVLFLGTWAFGAIYVRTGSGGVLLAWIVAVVWIAVLGLFEGAYNHAYKDVLYLFGASRGEALRLHPGAMKGDFDYPPNDAVFEISGILQFVASLFTAWFLAAAIRRRG